MVDPLVRDGVVEQAVPVDALAILAAAEEDLICHVLGGGTGAGQAHVGGRLDHADLIPIQAYVSFNLMVIPYFYTTRLNFNSIMMTSVFLKWYLPHDDVIVFVLREEIVPRVSTANYQGNLIWPKTERTENEFNSSHKNRVRSPTSGSSSCGAHCLKR